MIEDIALESPLYTNKGRRLGIISLQDQPHLLDLKLSEVSIMSSHNSFIRTLQIGGLSSLDALEIALARGSRFLELDIFRNPDDPNEVWVSHGNIINGVDIIETSKLDLNTALEFINSRAFKDTSDPLFLILQLNIDHDVISSNVIADLLEKNFNDKICDFNVTTDTILKSLLNKIVMIYQTGAGSDLLENIMNLKLNEGFINKPHTHSISSIKKYISESNIVRIYPDGGLFPQGTLGINYDPSDFFNSGVTFIAMNIAVNDVNMKKYEDIFKSSSFVEFPTSDSN